MTKQKMPFGHKKNGKGASYSRAESSLHFFIRANNKGVTHNPIRALTYDKQNALSTVQHQIHFPKEIIMKIKQQLEKMYGVMEHIYKK